MGLVCSFLNASFLGWDLWRNGTGRWEMMGGIARDCAAFFRLVSLRYSF